MTPNILWITTDQHNARCLGSSGSPDVRTPVLDELAHRGVRFSRAYCNNPICQPSRVSLITGQLPHRHGAYGNSFQMPDDVVPITQLLRSRGYHTGLIGKGHFGWDFVDREFDVHWLDDPGDVPDYEPLECDYLRFMIDHGVDGEGFFSGDVPLELSNETWVGNRAVEFLRARDPSRPFFCWVSFQRPHAPHTPSEPYKSMYDPGALQLPPNHRERMDDRGQKTRKRAEAERVNEAELRHTLSQYYGLISLIDAQIGRVLSELDDQNLTDRTAVFFSSDHGDFAGEYGMMFKEVGIYEPVHRVPMIACLPTVFAAGGVCDEIVENVDLFPTACVLAGIPVPDEVDGESLYPLLGMGGARQKHWSTCEHEVSNALRTQRYRLYVDEQDGGELYDHAQDPWETRNVYEEPDYAQIRNSLERKLQSITSTDSRVVTTWRNGWGSWGDQQVPSRLLWKGVPWQEVRKRFFDDDRHQRPRKGGSP